MDSSSETTTNAADSKIGILYSELSRKYSDYQQLVSVLIIQLAIKDITIGDVLNWLEVEIKNSNDKVLIMLKNELSSLSSNKILAFNILVQSYSKSSPLEGTYFFFELLRKNLSEARVSPHILADLLNSLPDDITNSDFLEPSFKQTIISELNSYNEN